MSPDIGLPAPRSAAAASLFRPGGDPYSLLPDPAFDLLPDLLPQRTRKAILNALPRIYRFFVKLAQAGELDERVTDQRIARAAGCSERIVQYVLNALDVIAGEGGFPFIRRTPSHGRRFIEFIRGFLPSGSRPTAVPPAPPIKTEETTTTREGSSSLRSAPENTGEGREVATPELIDRARRLIPKATPGKVVDVVALYGVDWVRRALDKVEKRNAKPGMKRVDSWGFVLRILQNWEREGGPGPEDPPPGPPRPQGMTAEELAMLLPLCKVHPDDEGNPDVADLVRDSRSKLRKAKAEGRISPELAAKIPAEYFEPPKETSPKLTAEEVAELVRKSFSTHRADLPVMSRVQLRQALAEGAIPAELVATIPAELVNPPKPRAP